MLTLFPMPCETSRVSDRLRQQLDKHLQIYPYRIVAKTAGIPWTRLRRFHQGAGELTLNEAEMLAESIGTRLYLDLPPIHKWPGQLL